MLQALQQSLGGSTALGVGLRGHLDALLGALANGASGAAGSAAVQIGMQLQLQLLLVATAAGADPAVQPAASADVGPAASNDPAVAKLAESVQALS